MVKIINRKYIAPILAVWFLAASASGCGSVKSDTVTGETTVAAQNDNILMEDTNWYDGDTIIEEYYGQSVLGSDIARESVVSVTFLDTLADMPDRAWDVSWNKDGSVMAWTKKEITGKYDLYIGAEGGVAAKGCRGLFGGYCSLERIEFNHCFDTSKAGDMSQMFFMCSALERLDMSGLDTGIVTDMRHMFYGCSGLTELDVSSLDTSSVTDMRCMFYGCSGLTELDVSRFDTSQVTDMGCMFSNCHSLTELNVSSFDTSQVTAMDGMFEMCESLTELDVSGFDTGRVTDMTFMFAGCPDLTAENTGLDTHGLEID